MEKLIGINTQLGIMHGRDAIFLDKINFDNESEVTLTGELNSDKGDRQFRMNFKGVVFLSTIELDFDERNEMESLAIIENSEKLKVFRMADHSSKTNDEHKHYYVRTYDTVFEIVSDRFEIELK